MFLTSLFGSANERFLRRLRPTVEAINRLEEAVQKLDDDALKAQTVLFRKRLEKGEAIDSLLPEAFATVREAAKRVLDQRHFDVQLSGGIVLHQGKIAEMKTGEGKTLVATLPAYLNALAGKGVHIVTVNDYLAKRDSEWMGQIYRFLGLEVGCIVSGLDDEGRRAAYQADVTYGTNNEFGFDYLRDNLKFSPDDFCQRAFHYAIIDEVDSILIDEARTPLIISGPSEESTDLYGKIDRLIPKLKPDHYEMDEKQNSITLTETGNQEIEQLVSQNNLISGEGGLYDLDNISLLHHINQALKAHHFFKRDRDYIVKDGAVIIIDEFTGRMMEGRRYSDGLHQAIEAKEGVAIKSENQTLASVTFQNYFRNYPKISGMTGTAQTEAAEFSEIYHLEVVDIPTNRPMRRKDAQDEIYRSGRERDNAVIACISDCHKKGQPVLVGTTSIEKSETLSQALKKAGVAHNVLNARYHEKEADIITKAGHGGAVTIATNMAGRGTDIQLGGAADTKEAQAERELLKEKGGLFIVGTERHESRRIDNQLRGRAGRQGDPGESRFFISLQDDLMRIFGADRMEGMLGKLGIEEGEAISHPWVTKALEKAQKKVEEQHFEIRKQLLRFDDVMNDQRKAVFSQRVEIMKMENAGSFIVDWAMEEADHLTARMMPAKSALDEWNLAGLHEECLRLFNMELPIKKWAEEEGIAGLEMKEKITAALTTLFDEKGKKYGETLLNLAGQSLLLQTLDTLWKDHLNQLDHLRQGINLRSYGQRDPLNEYRKEAFHLFEALFDHFRMTAVQFFCRLSIERPPPAPIRNRQAEASAGGGEKQGNWGRVSRNAPCPCGSGRKFKHCHGKL